MTPRNDIESERVHEVVRAGYGAIARTGTSQSTADEPASSGGSCCTPSPAGGCCAASAESAALAQSLGYSAADLAALPEGTNLGLSCGNPTAIAALQPGEVLLDLGSGAGLDVFVASPKLGPRGRAIGVDMTPEMLSRARKNVAAYRERTGLDNIEFRLGEIEHLPIADASVDVVISNCVLNLSPDQPQVWREIARVLKPGGRVAVSDLALERALPASVQGMLEALVGCVAGAALIQDTRRMASMAGLVEIEIAKKPDYVQALTSFEDPLYRRIAAELPEGTSVADFVTSITLTARKPTATRASRCC